jgi:hypothetical protein
VSESYASSVSSTTAPRANVSTEMGDGSGHADEATVQALLQQASKNNVRSFPNSRRGGYALTAAMVQSAGTIIPADRIKTNGAADDARSLMDETSPPPRGHERYNLRSTAARERSSDESGMEISPAALHALSVVTRRRRPERHRGGETSSVGSRRAAASSVAAATLLSREPSRIGVTASQDEDVEDDWNQYVCWVEST